MQHHPSVPDRTAKIALILYSRCLEAGKCPDRIEFTKYLYLLDWATTKLTGSPATEIRWKFYHYGPWSEDLIPVMALTQDHFRLSWVDYSPEDRDIPWFDAISEKLDLNLESIIRRILVAFAKRDASVVVDFCYRLTEPMRVAKRGEMLDFSTVKVTKEPPIFALPVVTLPMPQLSLAQTNARSGLRERAATVRAKYEKWKSLMQAPEYLEAMSKIAVEREVPTSTTTGRTIVKITDGGLAELDALQHE